MSGAGISEDDCCASLVAQAIAEQRAGRSSAAERLYAAALDICPDHPEANHNLAILLLRAGRAAIALEHFRIALEQDPDRELYWTSFARALLIAGRQADAAALLAEGTTHALDKDTAAALLAQVPAAAACSASRESAIDLDALATAQARALRVCGDTAGAVRRIEHAIAARPAAFDTLQVALGDLLAESGDIAGAVGAYERALAGNPGNAEAHHHLGSILSENGRVAEGFTHLMERAVLVHSPGIGDPEREPAHKLKHDREQRAFLHDAVHRAAASPRFVLADGARADGGAVNPANGGSAVGARWRDASPRFVVVDDFLLPDALERLRSYCAGSTVWKRVYDAGYIGATPEDGFACPLLAQIVEEIQEVYKPIVSGLPFRYLGAFKYDSELSTGTNTHADFSAVNVNLYITPDEANLAADSGGMVIFDLAAQTEEELRYYNGNEDALCRLLRDRGARPHRIPHRANRAILFDSSLFHRTDDCAFREGYLNKRINVSFLFGDWPRRRASLFKSSAGTLS